MFLEVQNKKGFKKRICRTARGTGQNFEEYFQSVTVEVPSRPVSYEVFQDEVLDVFYKIRRESIWDSELPSESLEASFEAGSAKSFVPLEHHPPRRELILTWPLELEKRTL